MKYNIEILNTMANIEDPLVIQYLKKGGIHIKEKNKGKFTDFCGGKVTAECIARGKRSSNPVTRKRATFAANARKWKHQEGGIITKPTFEEWIAMIPTHKVDLSPNSKYDYRVAYKYAPGDQLEAYALGDGHLMSAYEDPESGIYYFAKRKDHDTIDKELEFYYGNNPESREFRRNYILDTSGDFYKYIPVKPGPSVSIKKRPDIPIKRPR